MTFKFLTSVSALSVCALMTAPAAAQGFDIDAYVALFGGLGVAPPLSTTTSGLTYDDGGVLTLAPGFVGGAALGTQITPEFRGEIEVSFRRNGISSYVENGVAPDNLAATGDFLSALALMGNIWLDVPVSGATTVHVGGGVGGAILQMQLEEFDYDCCSPVDSSTMALAGQVGVGVSHELAGGATVSLDYRLMGTTPVTFEEVGGGATVTFNYIHSAILGGISIPIGE